jgi:hypothetical protein
MEIQLSNSMQPPDLKRKRSRPSDWWAVESTSNAPESTIQHDEPVTKKRGIGAGKGIQEAPAAGNRGKRRKTAIGDDEENAAEGSGEVAKPLRKGRSSNTEAELVAAAELAAEVEATNKKRRGRPPVREEAPSKNPGFNKKPVRSGAIDAQEDELVEAPVKERHQPSTGGVVRGERKSSRPSVSNVEEQISGRPESDELAPMKVMRQGQSSITQQRLPKVFSAQPSAEAKKRGRPRKSNDAEVSAGSTQESSNPPGRGRPSDSETELGGAIEATTSQSNITKGGGATAKKQAVHPMIDTELVEAVLSQRRTRRSDAEAVEPVVERSAPKDKVGQSVRSRRSGTVIQVECATSSLAKDRPTNKKSNNRPESSRVKSRKTSSSAQVSKARGQAKEPNAASKAEGRIKRKDGEGKLPVKDLNDLADL